MIGYGEIHYRYATGREGDTFRVGFSPRKSQQLLGADVQAWRTSCSRTSRSMSASLFTYTQDTAVRCLGEIHYRYATGREGDTFRVGFSPRKSAVSLYGLQGRRARAGRGRRRRGAAETARR
jgi:hypothetical protein